MKTLRAMLLPFAIGAATSLAFNVAWAIGERLVIPARTVVRDGGCIFHKPPGRWTRDDFDFMEQRIRRIEGIPKGGK